MNRKFALIGTGILLMCGSGAWADEHETTIRLMGAANAELPGVVTKELSLPEALAEDSAAVANAAHVLETASENRKMRREAGLSTADAAREDAAEMADGAAENRQNNGRSPERPERPGPQGPPEGA